MQQMGVGNRSKERDRKSELVLGTTYQLFKWDRNNLDRNFDFWETNRIAADRSFEKSIKRVSDISPFPLVPRIPLGPLMFPTCSARSNRSKGLPGTEIAKRSQLELVFATVRVSVHTPNMNPHYFVLTQRP